MQADKKKQDLRKKQQEKRLRLMAEESRLRELQKAALEEAEEENDFSPVDFIIQLQQEIK